jgi:hypothetical protein
MQTGEPESSQTEPAAGPGLPKPGPDTVRGSDGACGGGAAPGAGAGGVMALTWNQYWVPLVRPVAVQLEALPT